MKRFSYSIKGQVQGVGFRPFVYKRAIELDLVGFVNNNETGVEIQVQGKDLNIDALERSLKVDLPPLARVDSISKKEITLLKEPSFKIIESSQSSKNSKSAQVACDIAICKDCLRDIKIKGRFYNYFGTNCTNCGPRYSIIKGVPYDRKKTSMQSFLMCNECQKSYEDPHDRRYHAQPISCNNCGPKLSLYRDNIQIETQEIYKRVASYIKEGKIVAIKGIGGFHIVCDASSDEVVKKLRAYKNRPTKPFALMCKSLEQVKSFACVSEKEEELLSSKEAPIVILQKNKKVDDEISFNIAPNIDKIGCFLPYSGLHHLLIEHLQNPIVATSANLGDEPIITNKETIVQKLPFVDVILDFDREIINGVDDSLVQVVDEEIQILRASRGYAPKVVKLPFASTEKILAVGANQKNSIALVMDENIIISPHIGDLGSLEAFGYFERTLETFKNFYDFEPELIVHDKHPNYETTKWAKKQDKDLVELGHHLAHIYACKAEFGLVGDYLGFSFDGTGYGDDKTLWGGEIFVGDSRKYHFKRVKLLGGERAIKEPRRVALSMLLEELSFDEIIKLDLDVVKAFSKDEIKMLHQSFTKDLNAPKSSSVGRLFDAIASFSNIAQSISYEGESGLLCESFYDKSIKKCFNYTIESGVVDMNVVEYILKYKVDKKELSTMLINTLVKIIIEISKIEKLEVILSGGVFQNKTLLELVCKGLREENIKFYSQKETVINDGGIALGQAYYVLSKKIKDIKYV
ncbi:MAG: carbamoyltransferase HypF [Sulfurimonas sp.]|uniref:carbamoyltransferase HypF n=1 Tax=Sulfurimonas sp. TaxID=2022749 RepID=UPI0026012DC7|nr:carbamoyltransferase HypF [Sulfurimonas sp.]MCK9490645.1 carbamoyltransferase HypF [Sulfurimonas sp.]